MNRIIRRNRTYLQILTLIALVAFFLSVVATLEALGQQPSQSAATAKLAAPTVPQPPPALAPKSPESLFTVRLAARDLTIAAQNVQHLVDEANKQLVQLQQQQQQRQQELDRQIQLVKQQNNWGADVEWDAAREVFTRVAAAKPAPSPQPAAK